MKAPAPLGLLLVADNFVVRVGLASLLNSQADMLVIAEAASSAEAVVMYAQHRPDIVLVELRQSGRDGAECTAALCRRFPEARVIVLTAAGDGEIVCRALGAGACASLLDDLERKELLEAIRTVHAAPCP